MGRIVSVLLPHFQITPTQCALREAQPVIAVTWGFLGIFQHLWANQHHTTLYDATQWSSNAVWLFKQQQPAQLLHLTGSLPSHWVSNILGSVPLIPCVIAGNKHPTLQHGIVNFQGAVADTSHSPNSGNCSRPWMWCYGRGQPRKVSTFAKAGILRKILSWAAFSSSKNNLNQLLQCS